MTVASIVLGVLLGGTLIGGPASAEKPFREFFFDPFEKKTGIKIFYEGTNSATNLTKLRAEKASPKRSLRPTSPSRCARPVLPSPARRRSTSGWNTSLPMPNCWME